MCVCIVCLVDVQCCVSANVAIHCFLQRTWIDVHLQGKLPMWSLFFFFFLQSRNRRFSAIIFFSIFFQVSSFFPLIGLKQVESFCEGWRETFNKHRHPQPVERNFIKATSTSMPTCFLRSNWKLCFHQELKRHEKKKTLISFTLCDRWFCRSIQLLNNLATEKNKSCNFPK